jgi:hypothetical protein
MEDVDAVGGGRIERRRGSFSFRKRMITQLQGGFSFCRAGAGPISAALAAARREIREKRGLELADDRGHALSVSERLDIGSRL